MHVSHNQLGTQGPTASQQDQGTGLQMQAARRCVTKLLAAGYLGGGCGGGDGGGSGGGDGGGMGGGLQVIAQDPVKQ